jgi:hypothetical protein
MYCSFLQANGTPSEWDAKVANDSSLLTRIEMKSLLPMLEIFATRGGAQRTIKYGPKKAKKPVFLDARCHGYSSAASRHSHFHAAASTSTSLKHMTSFPSQAPLRCVRNKNDSGTAVCICHRECSQTLFCGVSDLAAYRTSIGTVRNLQPFIEAGHMWDQVALQIFSVR